MFCWHAALLLMSQEVKLRTQLLLPPTLGFSILQGHKGTQTTPLCRIQPTWAPPARQGRAALHRYPRAVPVLVVRRPRRWEQCPVVPTPSFDSVLPGLGGVRKIHQVSAAARQQQRDKKFS